jgi:ribosomal protein S2
LFITNAKASYHACKEADALEMNNIGVVDTDSPTQHVEIAVPGNDEGMAPIIFYNSFMTLFILYKKFGCIGH